MGVIVDLCKLSYSLVTGHSSKKNIILKLAKESMLKNNQTTITNNHSSSSNATSTTTLNQQQKIVEINNKDKEIEIPSIETTIKKNKIDIETIKMMETTISEALTPQKQQQQSIELKNIKGVGPKILKELNINGIFSVNDLKELSNSECESLKSKIKKIYTLRTAAQEFENK